MTDMMLRFAICLGILALLLRGTAAVADQVEEIFEPGDHCVAYRTIKDVFFGFDAEVIGRSCQVTASLVTLDAEIGPRIVVTVPVKSLRSGNILRNRSVADLLGAKTQPDLRFTSNPIEADSLRGDIARRSFLLPGTLSLGGRDFRLEFPLEVIQHEGRRYVKGRLPTTFAAFDVEVPTVAGGLIARPHEELELVVHLELERVEGLESWARTIGLQ